MFIYISVISFLIIISILLVSEVSLLKNDLKNLQHLYDRIESSRDFWRDEYLRKSLSSTRNTKILSEADLKSLIAMVHPDRHPENRKQRATELFIKLKEIQGSNP